MRRSLIALAIGVVAIVAAQSIATTTDHQHANTACFVIGLITLIYGLVQLHLSASRRGRRYVVPATIAVVLAGIFSLVRFDGFSGEMVPQFAFRFDEGMELADLDAESSDIALDDSAEANAIANSTNFLGTDRNGIIEKRAFAVPESAGDVDILWNQGIGEGWSSFAVAGDRAVTLEQRGEMECLTCYRLRDGKLLWIQSAATRHENALGGTGPRSTPTIDSGRVYAQGATGKVWCVDLFSGDEIWKLDLLEVAGWTKLESENAITWGRAGSPLIVDDMCVLPLGGPDELANSGRSLIALDAKDGTTRWTAGEAQISYGSPMTMTLAGVRQIVSVNEATVTGHSIEDGAVQWEFEWPGQSNAGANCASAVQAGMNRFIIGKGYGGGSALVEIDGDKTSMNAHAVWSSSSVLKTKFTHACLGDNVAYAISNGSLEAVNVESSDSYWRQPRSDRLGQGQLMRVEDVLVCQSESGHVDFVDAVADEYRLKLQLPALSTKTWNVPTIAGRHILVRNDRETICFYMPEKITN
ncbi:outer membrane protein assembly factor BamB family protein [Rubripirellula tenax]|uniref:outer membrane protein assembly factor BamB family protein n=1 Tax=Rubripirellula tenax TaxID=2528015 RepID=UPI0011B4F32F|nr:PQQ-binding-like beta-propeller repeat protein [Rubripirellula tenax]